MRKRSVHGAWIRPQQASISQSSTTQTQNQMERRLFLDIVIGQCASVLQLLPCEDQPLLVWRDAFFVLNFSFDVVNGVRCFDIKSNGLPSERLHKDLHSAAQA